MEHDCNRRKVKGNFYIKGVTPESEKDVIYKAKNKLTEIKVLDEEEMIEAENVKNLNSESITATVIKIKNNQQESLESLESAKILE